MILRSSLVLALVLLTGCPAEKPAPPAPPAQQQAAVEAPPAKPAQAPVDAGGAVVDAGAPVPPLVETELFGVATLGAVKSVKTVLVANKAPCVPVPEQLDVWGVENVAKPAKLFGEVFVADRTPVYFCVYALDATGAVVGAAQEAGSPRTIVGPEEVVLKDVRFAVKPVKPAVTPKGFTP